MLKRLSIRTYLALLRTLLPGKQARNQYFENALLHRGEWSGRCNTIMELDDTSFFKTNSQALPRNRSLIVTAADAARLLPARALRVVGG